MFFFIYVNELLLGLTNKVKLFENDTSLSSFINNTNVSASRLKTDLLEIQNWDFNWKMLFNPDRLTEEVIFSEKIIPGIHPSLSFNNSLIQQKATQIRLGLTLDHKLTFQYHVNDNMKKPRKKLVFFEKYSLFYLEHPY